MPLTKFSALKIFSVIFILVFFDQILKNAALAFLASPVYLNDFFSLEIYKNYGIGFGLPASAGVFYFAVFLFFIRAISGKFLRFEEMSKKEIIAVSFILGGALGNLIDRISMGYIVDFVNIGNIVIFNPADVFIALGAVILLEKFFPDAGKGRAKKNIYIFLFIIFGILISFLIHAAIEIWYINLLILDFSKYSFGLGWPQWYIIHSIGSIILFVGGSLFGYLHGRHWWKALYEDR